MQRENKDENDCKLQNRYGNAAYSATTLISDDRYGNVVRCWILVENSVAKKITRVFIDCW